MKEKKQHSNWYTALIHFSIAGFAGPVVFGFIIKYIVDFITQLLNLSAFINMVATYLVMILIVWLSVYYSANWINKHCIIVNRDSIVKISTIYFAVFIFLKLAVAQWGLLPSIINGLQEVGYNFFSSLGMILGIIIGIFFNLIYIFLFYKLSKKYIKITETSTI